VTTAATCHHNITLPAYLAISAAVKTLMAARKATTTGTETDAESGGQLAV